MALEEKFRAFAKWGNEDRSNPGKTMTLSNLQNWMKQGKLFDKNHFKKSDVSQCFTKFKSKAISLDQLMPLIEDLSNKTTVPPQVIITALLDCGPPGAPPVDEQEPTGGTEGQEEGLVDPQNVPEGSQGPIKPPGPGQGLPKPPVGGQGLPKPPVGGQGLPKPPIGGQGAPTSPGGGQGLPKPPGEATMPPMGGQGSPKPPGGQGLPKPPGGGQGLPKPQGETSTPSLVGQGTQRPPGTSMSPGPNYPNQQRK